jgi:hypothetical protein
VRQGETEPRQECWRKQCRVLAPGTIDPDEIARPEILDAGRVERDHLHALCSLFVPWIEHHEPGGVVNGELTIARIRGAVERLCGLLELLEPDRQPVSIGTILIASRPVDQCSGNRFEAEFEKRTIMNFEQSV